MIDPTPNEIAAMAAGGKAGGEYLERLGKTNLVVLNEAEWDTFVDMIVTGYYDRLRELAARDRARLEGLTPEVPF